MHIKRSIECELLNTFSFITNDTESLVVRCKKRKFAFAVMYRPPDGSLSTFFDHVDNLLNYANQNKLTLILGGDFNIDMLKVSTSQHNFETILQSHGFTNVIKAATCITPNSTTLLDLFITNLDPNDTLGGVLTAPISDHLPIFFGSTNLTKLSEKDLLLIARFETSIKIH